MVHPDLSAMQDPKAMPEIQPHGAQPTAAFKKSWLRQLEDTHRLPVMDLLQAMAAAAVVMEVALHRRLLVAKVPDATCKEDRPRQYQQSRKWFLSYDHYNA